MSDGRRRRNDGTPDTRPGSRLRPFSVAELNTVADSQLRGSLGVTWVAGEIVKFLAHRSGHWYFQLVGDDAAVSCAMFRSRNARVPFSPDDGMEVVLLAAPGIYAAQGRFQLIVESIEPRGRGAAALALEQLRRSLAQEGLFDAARKRRLPLLPREIGIATSIDGAALQDVLRVLRRRFAGVRCLVADTIVQGAAAPFAIVAAIDALEARMPDVLLVVRGGGSPEDLAAFNDEAVVRRIAACRVPLVTGIGHEIDTTLADLAADVRAATPSAAAELVMAERDELVKRVTSMRESLADRLRHRLLSFRNRLSRLAGSRGMRDAPRSIQSKRVHVGDLAMRADRATHGFLRGKRRRLGELVERLAPTSRLKRIASRRREIERIEARIVDSLSDLVVAHRRRLAATAARLEAMSPLSILDRGFALVTRGDRSGALVRDADTLASGDDVFVRLARGAFVASVVRTDPDLT